MGQLHIAFVMPRFYSIFMHDINDKNTTLTPLSLIEKLGVFDYDPCGIQHHKTANKIINKYSNETIFCSIKQFAIIKK